VEAHLKRNCRKQELLKKGDRVKTVAGNGEIKEEIRNRRNLGTLDEKSETSKLKNNFKY